LKRFLWFIENLGLVYSLPDLKKTALQNQISEIENRARKKSPKESGLQKQNRGREQNFPRPETFFRTENRQFQEKISERFPCSGFFVVISDRF
jgi:hypothetical protein